MSSMEYFSVPDAKMKIAIWIHTDQPKRRSHNFGLSSVTPRTRNGLMLGINAFWMNRNMSRSIPSTAKQESQVAGACQFHITKSFHNLTNTFSNPIT